MSKSTKQYGLILPKKAALSAPKSGNIFGDDGDSDADDGADWVKKALKAEGEKHKVKKQTRLNMEKALNEDPTIYQYDEVYDEIEKVKEQSKPVKKALKQPKYIHSLLKAAERRKIEQEHRTERMVQKEREAEGEKYADKESFVTSAYREKLEQFKKMQQEEERMDRLESIADVTKQPDMSGFHRHLFAQKFNPESNDEEKKSEEPKSPSQSSNIDKDEDLSVDSSSEAESASEGEENGKNKEEEGSKMNFKGKNKRQYRKRVMEESEPESEEETAETPEHDGDKQIIDDDTPDKHAGDKEEKSPTKKPRLSPKTNDEEKKESVKSITGDEGKTFKSPESKPEKPEKDRNPKKAEPEEEEPEEEKPSIWEKRTVGPVFEAALQRYYTRKALRLSGT